MSLFNRYRNIQHSYKVNLEHVSESRNMIFIYLFLDGACQKDTANWKISHWPLLLNKLSKKVIGYKPSNKISVRPYWCK